MRNEHEPPFHCNANRYFAMLLNRVGRIGERKRQWVKENRRSLLEIEAVLVAVFRRLSRIPLVGHASLLPQPRGPVQLHHHGELLLAAFRFRH